MAIGRAQHTATAIGSGRTLLCGGQTGTGASAVETATCEIYLVEPIFGDGFEPVTN